MFLTLYSSELALNYWPLKYFCRWVNSKSWIYFLLPILVDDILYSNEILRSTLHHSNPQSDSLQCSSGIFLYCGIDFSRHTLIWPFVLCTITKGLTHGVAPEGSSMMSSSCSISLSTLALNWNGNILGFCAIAFTSLLTLSSTWNIFNFLQFFQIYFFCFKIAHLLLVELHMQISQAARLNFSWHFIAHEIHCVPFYDVYSYECLVVLLLALLSSFWIFLSLEFLIFVLLTYNHNMFLTQDLTLFFTWCERTPFHWYCCFPIQNQWASPDCCLIC